MAKLKDSQLSQASGGAYDPTQEEGGVQFNMGKGSKLKVNNFEVYDNNESTTKITDIKTSNTYEKNREFHLKVL